MEFPTDALTQSRTYGARAPLGSIDGRTLRTPVDWVSWADHRLDCTLPLNSPGIGTSYNYDLFYNPYTIPQPDTNHESSPNCRAYPSPKLSS